MIFYDFINFRLIFLIIYNKILSFLCLQVINVFLKSHSWKLEHQVQCSFENISLYPCILVFSCLVVVVLRSPIHANEPSEYNGMLYRTSNRVLNNGIKVIILICMDGTSQYHHHQLFHPTMAVSSRRLACIVHDTFFFHVPLRNSYSSHSITFPCAVHSSCVFSVYSQAAKLWVVVFNGWQLAKMKKSIPDMSLP